MPGVKTSARKDGDGYVMEVFIPQSALQNYRPKLGSKIGVAVVNTIFGHDHRRSVYWLVKKGKTVCSQPESWGTLNFAK